MPERIVHSRTPKTTDVEVHVSTLTIEGGLSFTEIREFIISLDQYGRGITFPAALAGDVAEGLSVARYGLEAASS